MKRFHAHVAVNDIADSIQFYTKLFNQNPKKEREDYAKWELDEPRLNFAISASGHTPGLNHFGFQAENTAELDELKKNAERASPEDIVSEAGAACCYAKSDKHWTVDPQGIAWENFLTLADGEDFGVDTQNQAGACCIPLRTIDSDEIASDHPCCLPTDSTAAKNCCR